MKRLLTLALLALSSTVFAATLNPIQLLNPAGSTSGQAIVSTGASTAPAWGSVTVGGLGSVAANTVLANATGSSATPTAFAMPSCSGANNALRWTSGSGFTCASAIALTSGALSQFAATTSAQLIGVISDETGSGALVFGTSPTITTPTLNQPVINGVTNGAGAGAGVVGQVICAQVTNGGSPAGCATNSSTPVSMTNNVAVNITSISLPAGDWDVWGSCWSNPAGTTITNVISCWTSTTSATNPTAPNFGSQGYVTTSTTAGALNMAFAGYQFLNLSATTTVFLSSNIQFTTSTLTAYGFIAARRRH